MRCKHNCTHPLRLPVNVAAIFPNIFLRQLFCITSDVGFCIDCYCSDCSTIARVMCTQIAGEAPVETRGRARMAEIERGSEMAVKKNENEKQWAGWNTNGDWATVDVLCAIVIVCICIKFYFHGGSIVHTHILTHMSCHATSHSYANKPIRREQIVIINVGKIANMMAIFKFAINAARTIIVPLMIERIDRIQRMNEEKKRKMCKHKKKKKKMNVNHIDDEQNGWHRLATICIFMVHSVLHNFPIIL